MSLLGFHTWRYVCCIFNIICVCLQMSCVPALCAPTERPASTEWRSCRLSDGSCSAERRSKPTRTKYTNLTAVFFFFGSHTPFVFVWHYSVMQSQSITCHFRWLEAEATFDSSKRKLKELVLSFSPSSSSPSLIPQNDYVQFKFNDLSDPQKNDLSLAHTSMLQLQ